MSRDEFEDLARDAVQCRECFKDTTLVAPQVDIAQPRWVGPSYWRAAPRVALLLLNPGGGEGYEPGPDKNLRDLLYGFRERRVGLDEVLEHQRHDLDRWGRGRFVNFYFVGLGLNPDDVALANVAWCATSGNRYPTTMLEGCFSRHTAKLLEILRPDVVLASGGAVHRFTERIKDLLPRSTVLPVLHFAHRLGTAAERTELARVRAFIARGNRKVAV